MLLRQVDFLVCQLCMFILDVIKLITETICALYDINFQPFPLLFLPISIFLDRLLGQKKEKGNLSSLEALQGSGIVVGIA